MSRSTTTFAPSQATLFEDGSEGRLTVFPTPRVSGNRASRGALTRDGHWSAPALEQAAELAEGRLPREFRSEEELTPQAQRLLNLTSSLPATPVSPSPSPASGLAVPTRDTSGQRLLGLLRKPGPPDSWVRTLLGTSRWASMPCCPTWKPSATPLGRWLFRLAPSARCTGGSGSGSWPTQHTPTSKANQLSPSMVERDAGSWGRDIDRAGDKLSPSFVESLMGFPLHFTLPEGDPLHLDPDWDGDPLGAFGRGLEYRGPLTVASTPERAGRLRSLGNAIVPQVALVILQAMDEGLA